MRLISATSIATLFSLLPVAVTAQYLGPAPRLDDSTVIPRTALPKSAIVGSPINTQRRGEVVGQFFSRWWPYLSVPAAWTGSVAGCVAGDISSARKEATITSVNYYRAMTGLADTVALNATFNGNDQQMALMISANDQLSHTPPPSWLCYTAAGADAASHSNIALGASGPDAIDLYMDDPGSGNYAAGHRRWILYPPQAQMGTGDVEGGDAPEQGNALGVLYGFGSRPATPEWVAWPPPGFVPYWLLPSQSNRWSLSYPNADFSGAIVTMTRGTTPITVTYETQVNNQGYADNTLVWLPQGVSYSAPTSDTTYGITLSNVLVSGQSRTFSYAVTVIKPVKPAKLGDLDNDGFSDLVWRNSPTQQGALWFMKSGVLDHNGFFNLPTGWMLRGTGDLNGDGKADLIWTNAGTNQLAIWFMNGATIASTAFFGLGSGWDLAAVGDFNGDGKADLLFRNNNGAVLAWLMNGASIASTVVYPSAGSDWTIVGTGDFVGTGKQQVLWRYLPTGDLVLWKNADTPAVQTVGLGQPGGTWQVRALGDFDGDGVTDLFWRNIIGENAIWLSGNSATATFPPGVGTDWNPVASSQYYGDGRSNILWQRSDGLVAQWRFDAALVPSATFLTTVPLGWVPAGM